MFRETIVPGVAKEGQPTEEIEPQRIWRERNARYALEIRIELALMPRCQMWELLTIMHHDMALHV